MVPVCASTGPTTVMKTPYLQDQIWNSGCCDIHELAADEALDRVIAARNIADRAMVHLVDALPAQLEHHPIIVTDNVLTRRNDYHQLWPEFYGVYYWPFEYQLHLPSTTFSCFINRADSFRQSWMYQLQRINMLQHGHVNYNLDLARARELEGMDFADQLAVFDYYFAQGNDIFRAEHQQLRDQMPYCSFDLPMEPAIIDSKIQLVLETYTDNHAIALSEKTFRALQLPRPWLLFASTGAVAHLTRCGFDVFDDLVDHAYDSIENSAERQTAILHQITRWHTVEFTESLQQRLAQGLVHNQLLLKTLQQQWPDQLQNATKYLYAV